MKGYILLNINTGNIWESKIKGNHNSIPYISVIFENFTTDMYLWITQIKQYF